MSDTAVDFAPFVRGASSIAPTTDRLFATMLAICGLMALALACLVVWFCIRYRAGTAADRRHPPSHANGLEAAWTALPFALFVAVFAWAAYAYVQTRRVPADALPIYVVAKQWMWKLQHANGRQEINELHVPLGRPVVLVLASQDAIHSFYVPAFRLKQDVVPGRTTRLWFTATALGDFRILCSEYCGSQHSAMLGRVVVMRQADYARWLAGAPADATGPAAAGAALYRRLACASCHAADSSVHAPPLEGLYGRRVALEGGAEAIADEDYLRTSIVDPRRQIVRGQPALMPSYAGQLSEEELLDLVAYLRSLAATSPGP